MLRKLLRTIAERPERDITQSEIALGTGLCDATLSNFLNYKKELTIPAWILCVRFLAPQDEESIFNTLTDEMIETENRLNCRLLMEYASTTRNFTLLEKLITSQKNAPKENKNWAEMYSIALKFQLRNTNSEELISLIDNYKPNSIEMKVFSQILKARVLYRMGEYKSMFRVALLIEKETEQIKNSYIRENYLARISEIYAHGYLYLKNDVKKARYFANNVLNSKFLCPKFTLHMYHLLGTSFVFEDFHESLNYFNMYASYLKQFGRIKLHKEVEQLDIHFVKVLWGNDDKDIYTDDALEKMHSYARKGEVKNVEELFREVNPEDPFALCYLGMVKNDPELLLHSIKRFLETGNKFFAELPKKEIKKYPVFDLTASVMCELNIA